MSFIYTHLVVKELIDAGFTKKQAEVFIKWFILKGQVDIGDKNDFRGT